MNNTGTKDEVMLLEKRYVDGVFTPDLPKADYVETNPGNSDKQAHESKAPIAGTCTIM